MITQHACDGGVPGWGSEVMITQHACDGGVPGGGVR